MAEPQQDDLQYTDLPKSAAARAPKAQPRLQDVQYSDLPKSAAPSVYASPKTEEPAQHGYENLPKDAHPSARGTSTQAPPTEDTDKTWGSVAGVPYKKSSFSLGNLYANGLRGVGELGSTLYNVGNDIVNNPDWFTEKNGKFPTGKAGETSMLSKYMVQPALAEHNKAITAKTGLESVGHSVAEAIPFIGPWVSNLSEQAGTGDVGGALARGGTQLGVAKLVTEAPGMTKGVVKGGLKAIGKSIAENTPKAEPLGLLRPGEASNIRAVIQPENLPGRGQVPLESGYPARFEGGKIPLTKGNEVAVQAPDGSVIFKSMGKTPEQLGLRPVSEFERMTEVEPPKSTKPIGTIATPEEVASVEHVGGQRVGDMMQAEGAKPSSEVINRTAEAEVRKFKGEDSPEQAEARRLMRNRVPSDLQDTLVRDHPDVGQRFVKGTNANYAEMANELGLEGAKNENWQASDFSRSGKGMSEMKSYVMRHLMENYQPEEILNMTEHWGGK